jgi:hypothetical protein
MKTLSKNTKKCDRCEKALNLDEDKAYCFHSDEGEVYICSLCVAEVFNEYVENMDEK